MLFNNIIGQQATKQKLVDMLQHNRLSHALLFLGKEGSGALPLAMAFANYVSLYYTATKPSANLFGEAETTTTLTTNTSTQTTPNEADDYIMQHQAYSKISGMQHPDIHYTYPIITKKNTDKPLSSLWAKEWRAFIKEQPYGNAYDWLQFIGAENKQGNISALECNDIIYKLSLKSFESEFKILILWMPEFLGKEGNKLLKLIEEPPPNTLFIFVAESEEAILDTILSRTQLVRVPLPTDEEIIQHLRTHTDVVQAMQVTALAEGNVRAALQILQQPESDWLLLVRASFNAIKQTGPTGMMQWVATMAELGREKQKQYLRYTLHLFEYTIKYQILGTSMPQLTNAEFEFIQKLSNFATIDSVEEMAKLVNDQIYTIERNANAKMLFHALIIKLYHIVGNKHVILIH